MLYLGVDMSRSRRKSPFCGLGSGSSEKFDKRKNNRKLRQRCKDAIRQGKESMPLMNEISDPWTMTKDGRIHLDKDSKEMRK
jgi:hypothetical protein